MSMKPMNRRQAIGKTLFGTLGGLCALDQLSQVQWMEKLLLPSLGGPGATNPFVGGMMGTMEILQSALRGGAGLLRAQQAFAQTGTSNASKEWAVVTIKVVNHVHTPLVFKLGKRNEQTGAVTTGSDVNTVASKLSTSSAHMVGRGVDMISDNPRFANLRFNKWFADILQTGKSDVLNAAGAPVLDSATLFPGAGAFPSTVAVQAGLHLMQEFTANNHSLLNFRLRGSEGDLAHFVEKKGIIRSPLGITAFMMGDNYDRAEGAFSKNMVLGDSEKTETPIAAGVSVKQIVETLSQSLQAGYGDTRPFEENAMVKFDKLVSTNLSLRKAMIDSKEQFRQSLAELNVYKDIELVRQVGVSGATGSLQGTETSVNSEAPGQEFVAQCGYTARSLKLDGRPIRNYSLFLNMSDLDGRNLDQTSTGGELIAGLKCYTYVEGMRQLAVGLNILAKVIDEKKNVLVVVVSEGGRSSEMGDDKVSFGLVMGPSGSGMLCDALYANTSVINEESNAVIRNPGGRDNATPWNVDGLVTDAGASLTGSRATTTGDFQLGVAEFLAEKMGVANSMQGQVRYVKLKRGT